MTAYVMRTSVNIMLTCTYVRTPHIRSAYAQFFARKLLHLYCTRNYALEWNVEIIHLNCHISATIFSIGHARHGRCEQTTLGPLGPLFALVSRSCSFSERWASLSQLSLDFPCRTVANKCSSRAGVRPWPSAEWFDCAFLIPSFPAGKHSCSRHSDCDSGYSCSSGECTCTASSCPGEWDGL